MADSGDDRDGNWANVIGRNTFIATMIASALFIGASIFFIFL